MKRTLRRVAIACIAVFLVAAAYLLGYVPAMWPTRTERRSIEILLASNTPAELREAVAPLGVFLQYPDDSWVAIRYRDAHNAWLWNGSSSAVVRCSDGSWYRSGHHFCGRFMIYEQLRTDPRQAHRRESSDWFDGLDDIHALVESRTLGEAKQTLMAMPFERFTP